MDTDLGGDQAEPLTFGDMEVTVRTDLTPSDITVGDVDDVNMKIRFLWHINWYNSWKSNLQNRGVASVENFWLETLFYDTDGILECKN